MNEKHKFKKQDKPIINLIKITNPDKNNKPNHNNKDSIKQKQKK